MKKLLNVILLMIVLVPCRAQMVKPELKLIKGNTYYSITDLNTAITQTLNGQEMTYDIGMSTKTAFTVLDVKDTVYQLEVNYKNIGMKMQLPGRDAIEYSSDNKNAQDIPGRMLVAMVDKPFFVTISKSGKVLAVEDIEKVKAAVINSLGITDTAQAQQLKSQFTQSFGEKAVKSTLTQTFSIYPGVKVSKNDKWMVNTLLESVMLADVQTTYQLQDITANSYVIHGDSKVTTVNNGTVAQMGGMPVKYDLNGAIVNDITVDKTSGWVTQSKLKEAISGNIEIQDNPKVPGGMAMPMSITVNAITTDQ